TPSLGKSVPRNFIDEARCPACDNQGMEYNTETVDLPYLGESLETMLRCRECGFRHTDFILTDTKDPTRYKLVINEEDDIMIRVVRSASGTIRIPELGVEIEPGVASDAYISNVEGVMVRIEKVLFQLLQDAETEEAATKIQDMVEFFGRMRTGTADPVTLILEDPFGNSAILSEKAVVEKLDEKEAARLQTGMHIIQQDGPVTAADSD
ncbi:MAG: ZPR1 zinc finger domain-containing protein, partial [Thermoplasmatota archaeon]